MKGFSIAVLTLVAVFAASNSASGAELNLKFRAALSGAQEVTASPGPSAGVTTDTTGRIRVKFDEALTELEFRLEVREGINVTVAHFHCGRPGEIGPPMVFLFGPVPMPVSADGELARGTRTNADFVVADCITAIGRPVNNIASLAFAMRDGLIYANVHTMANPGGEIRGQLLEQ